MKDKKYNEYLKDVYEELDKTKLEDIEEEIVDLQNEVDTMEKKKNDFVTANIDILVDDTKKKKKNKNRRRHKKTKTPVVKIPK